MEISGDALRDAEPELPEELLRDIRTVFQPPQSEPLEALHTVDLLNGLCRIEEWPWRR